MTAPESGAGSWGELVSFTAGLAVVRARRGLLTEQEIRDALDEAYRMGQASRGDCRACGGPTIRARLSYWIRPYDARLDARCWRWRRPGPCRVIVLPDAPPTSTPP